MEYSEVNRGDFISIDTPQL